MRQSRSSSGSPAAITKYLLPREIEVARVRQHPAVLIPASALTLGGLLLAGILGATVLHGIPADVLWVAWLVLLLRLVWKVLNWSVDYFVVTTERLLLTRGFLTRRVNMLPLPKIVDMSFERSFPGRLLGYGAFTVETAGKDQALRNVEFIPYPEQLYLLICGMLFPSSAEDMEDSGPEDWGDPSVGDPRSPGPDDDPLGRQPRPPAALADEL
jgi:membrane protein YdbS with pleckstrin-like domain